VLAVKLPEERPDFRTISFQKTEEEIETRISTIILWII